MIQNRVECDHLEKTDLAYNGKVNGVPRRQTDQTPSGFKPVSNNAAYYQALPYGSYTGKRLFDLFLCTIALLGYAVLFPVFAAGIKLSSTGPVIYKQKRTGLHGKVFLCHKFRTMHLNSDQGTGEKPVITSHGDPRIFGFGSLLRKANLDELPQVINVLKGDMSFIGPRPYPVDECAWWNARFDTFSQRYTVRPGLSGLAQVRGMRGGTFDEKHMRKRTDFDLEYCQKNSFLLDFKIAVRTVLQMMHLSNNGH